MLFELTRVRLIYKVYNASFQVFIQRFISAIAIAAFAACCRMILTSAH